MVQASPGAGEGAEILQRIASHTQHSTDSDGIAADHAAQG
jgi:hypothetical protein